MRDVRLSEAVVRYEDDSTGMRAGVDPLDLRLSGDLSGERSDLDLRLEAHRLSYAAGGVALLRDADLTADVTLDADLKNKRFTFSDNRLSLNAIALSLDGWVALADDRTEMDVRVNSSKVEFRDVLSLVPAFYTRDFENLTASGQLTLDERAKGVLAGDRLPAFETTLAVRDGSFKYASLPKAVTGITIDARAANPGGTADATTVDVPTFALTMAGNALRGSFSAATPDERPALQGGRRRQGRSGGCEGGLSVGRFDRAGGRRDGRHAGVGADVRHRAGALRGDRGFGAAHRRRGYGGTRGIARSEGAPRRDERQPCGADPFGAGRHGGAQRHRSVGHAVEVYRLSLSTRRCAGGSTSVRRCSISTNCWATLRRLRPIPVRRPLRPIRRRCVPSSCRRTSIWHSVRR